MTSFFVIRGLLNPNQSHRHVHLFEIFKPDSSIPIQVLVQSVSVLFACPVHKCSVYLIFCITFSAHSVQRIYPSCFSLTSSLVSVLDDLPNFYIYFQFNRRRLSFVFFRYLSENLTFLRCLSCFR